MSHALHETAPSSSSLGAWNIVPALFAAVVLLGAAGLHATLESPGPPPARVSLPPSSSPPAGAVEVQRPLHYVVLTAPECLADVANLVASGETIVAAVDGTPAAVEELALAPGFGFAGILEPAVVTAESGTTLVLTGCLPRVP